MLPSQEEKQEMPLVVPERFREVKRAFDTRIFAPQLIAFMAFYVAQNELRKKVLLAYLKEGQQSVLSANNSFYILYHAKHTDFSSTNLTQVYLQNLNLSRANLSEAQLPQNLSNTNLSGAQLPCDLTHHNLRYANLSHTDLTHVQLPQNLAHTNLTGAQLHCDLSQHNLYYANLSHTDLTHVQLPHDLTKTKLVGADMSGNDLSHSQLPQDLSETKLSQAILPQNLVGVNLTQAILPQNLFGVNLSSAILPQNLADSHFYDVDLSYTDLRYIQLPQELSRTRLIGANLSQNDLRGRKLPKKLLKTKLYGTNLSGADLSYCQLPADLSETVLTHANLRGTDLRHCQLPSNLSGVNLSQAKLPKLLAGTNLRQAKLPENLSGLNLSEAILPQDLSYTTLTGANVSLTDFRRCKLPYDLSNTDLSETKLPEDLSRHRLMGANLSGTDLSHHKLPKDLSRTDLNQAKLPQDLSDTNFTQATLPKELSEADLRHANFSGVFFTYTHFEWAYFKDIIVVNTRCNYQQCFLDNIVVNRLKGGDWYRTHLPEDLKSIALVYPQLSKERDKVELLQIASGLAYLPYYQDIELEIKVHYWSCKLLLLKNKLKVRLGDQLVCSLAHNLAYEARTFCWQTDFPEYLIEEEEKEEGHADFADYLQCFQEGLKRYNVKSQSKWGYHQYKTTIEKNIQTLEKCYPKLTSEKFKKEAVTIARMLSRSWQRQHLDFLLYYLNAQNRLTRLAMRGGVSVKNDLYYHCSAGQLLGYGWQL